MPNKKVKSGSSWVAFNDMLMKITNPTEVEQLIAQERSGERRPQYLLRLYSRFNRLRSLQEREQLFAQLEK